MKRNHNSSNTPQYPPQRSVSTQRAKHCRGQECQWVRLMLLISPISVAVVSLGQRKCGVEHQALRGQTLQSQSPLRMVKVFLHRRWRHGRIFPQHFHHRRKGVGVYQVLWPGPVAEADASIAGAEAGVAARFQVPHRCGADPEIRSAPRNPSRRRRLQR